MTVRNTFPKSERLCGEKTITRLFNHGVSGFVYPFKYIYLCEGDSQTGVRTDADNNIAADGWLADLSGSEGGVEAVDLVGLNRLSGLNGSSDAMDLEDLSDSEGLVADSRRVALLVSVSKRYHKRANKRNLNKRRIREAYRLNKSILTESSERNRKSVNLALIYVTKEISEYKTVENAIKKILTTVASRL